MFVLIYVDDIIITASHESAIDDLLQNLKVTFLVKEFRNINYFLGVEVIWLNSGLLMYQQGYILDLLKKTNMLEAKPISSPMSSLSSLSTAVGDPMEDTTLFRSTMGSLQYLSLTRPDLAFSVDWVC